MSYQLQYTYTSLCDVYLRTMHLWHILDINNLVEFCCKYFQEASMQVTISGVCKWVISPHAPVPGHLSIHDLCMNHPVTYYLLSFGCVPVFGKRRSTGAMVFVLDTSRSIVYNFPNRIENVQSYLSWWFFTISISLFMVFMAHIQGSMYSMYVSEHPHSRKMTEVTFYNWLYQKA